MKGEKEEEKESEDGEEGRGGEIMGKGRRWKRRRNHHYPSLPRGTESFMTKPTKDVCSKCSPKRSYVL